MIFRGLLNDNSWCKKGLQSLIYEVILHKGYQKPT
jgi:hypothetical protein